MIKYNELFKPTLEILSDNKTYTTKEINRRLAKRLGLAESELAQVLPSGRQSVFNNRTGWARTYLKKAGLITSPSRAHFMITEEGIRALGKKGPIDLEFLNQYPSFQSFQQLSRNQNEQQPPRDIETDLKEKTPYESLEDAYAAINNSLSSDLMDEVMKLSPVDFEHLVVRLLLKMGYGSGIEAAGIVTQASNDGGIDGIIKEDQLGFSSIFIQAKQWQIGNTVGKPEIQKFAGALLEQNASKGLFITTSSYSQGAKEYVKNSGGATIVLIDGDQLMKLMIKHNLGVSIEATYAIKRVDFDFFSEDI